MDASEIEKLPEKHNARKNPDMLFERSVIEEMDLPPITKITNRTSVFFDGEDPIY
jgi:hypothetical protein